MGDIRGDVSRGGDGNFEQKYRDSDIVDVLRAAFPEPLSASEIGERAEMARTTAHNRLDDLVDDGVVDTKKLGARSRAYWLVTPPETPETGE